MFLRSTQCPPPTRPGITTGPDGNIWFTEHSASGNKIGKVTTSGAFTEYPLPYANCSPDCITAGPDGNLWFGESLSNKIGKITTSGVFTEYQLSTPNGDIRDIIAGPDGNVWFTETLGNKIGKITPGGAITEYMVPTSSSRPSGITVGMGCLWFAEQHGQKIGVIETNGTINEFPVPSGKNVEDVAFSQDSSIWFTESGDTIGVLKFVPSPFYFAEGTCRPGFDAYFCIQNPMSQTADVTLTYMKGDGTTVSEQLSVCPGSRSTVFPRNKLGTGNDAAHDFSTKVESTNGQEIIVERPMYFNYMGASSNNWNGGHDAVGADAPAEVVGFAEGTCRTGFDTYFCVQNPGGSSADVTITYLCANGDVLDREIKVPAHARATVNAVDSLGSGDDEAYDFSTIVECTNGQKIIAERPMYFNYDGGHRYNWTGGSDVMGTAYLSKDFFFAEGTCRPGFDTYICLMNPTDTDSKVTLTYMKGDGTTVVDQVKVPWGSRLTVVPRNKLGTGEDAAHDFSTSLVSDQPIIAERPMYFNYNGGQNYNWNGGHDVMGAMESAQAFTFAEGTARPGFDTYFCISNPGSTAAQVILQYMRGSGAPVEQRITVAPHSRSTVRPRDTLGVADDAAHDFATMVYCTNDQKIIVERPMYFDYCSNYNYQWTGGSDVVGLPGVVSVAATAEAKSASPGRTVFSAGSQQPKRVNLGDLLKANRN